MKKTFKGFKNFFKTHYLENSLSIFFIVAILNSVAIIVKAIEFSTGISIYALVVALCVLNISMYEIRIRLRPWIYISKIDLEVTLNPSVSYSYFTIMNTGPIPASSVRYTVKWYIKENGTWKQLEITDESPFESVELTLFPNQSIKHQSEMNKITAITQNNDLKANFFIKYRGLWSKHTTTNTHKFDYAHQAWTPDKPQDYT